MIWRNNKGKFYIVMINLVLKAKERDSRKLNQIKIFFKFVSNDSKIFDFFYINYLYYFISINDIFFLKFKINLSIKNVRIYFI